MIGKILAGNFIAIFAFIAVKVVSHTWVYSIAICLGRFSNKRGSTLRFSCFSSRAFLEREKENIWIVAVALRTYVIVE